MKKCTARALFPLTVIVLTSQLSFNANAQLGSVDADLVYTPVTPCRIFDTRSAGGAISAGTAAARDYFVYGSAGAISAQGGNSAGCPAPQGEPAAVHLNVTVVPKSGQVGNARVYPKDDASSSSTVNFRGLGAVANAITIKSKFDITDRDITVQVDSAQSLNVLADVQGYYYPASHDFDYGGFDIFGSGIVHNSSTAKNVTGNALDTPSLTTEAGDNIYFSATVAVQPLGSAVGSVEVNLYPCRFVENMFTPIAQAYTTAASEVESCYAGVDDNSHILLPISGVMENVPAGSWEFSICADNSSNVACAASKSFETFLENMTVINLGK